MSGRIDRDSAHYRIGPLTTYADPAELDRSFQRATAGERLTYAIGPSLSATALTRVMVIGWQEQGLCHLARHREGVNWRYFVEKRAVAAPCPAAGGAKSRIAGRPEERLFHVLLDLAADGAPLLSLDLLAEHAALPDRLAANYRLRVLVDGGFIRLRREGINRFAEILKPEAGL